MENKASTAPFLLKNVLPTLDSRYVNITGDTMTGDLVLFDNTLHVKDYTLTIPATGTVAMLGVENVFTATQTINAAAIFNETGNDVNFRVEGDTDTTLFFLDASADKVGIGDSAPGEKLDVAGNTNVTGVYKVDDVQVVSNRVVDDRIDDAINSGDATTDGVIDAIRDCLIAHGLCAAS